MGHTSNLAERLAKHNAKHRGYTGKVNDWKIVYTESFLKKEDAYARERQIKKWKNRKRIESLIQRG